MPRKGGKLSSHVHIKPVTVKKIDSVGNFLGNAVSKALGVETKNPVVKYINPYSLGREIGENYLGPALIKAGAGVKPKTKRQRRSAKDVEHDAGTIRDKPLPYTDPRDPAGIITTSAAVNRRVAHERAADPVYLFKDFTYRPTPVPGYSQFDH